MKKTFQGSFLVLCGLLVGLNGCASIENKAPVVEDEIELTQDELNGGGVFAGELEWCALHQGSLAWYRPYQIWHYDGSSCSDTFIDLASREGNDMFLILYSRSVDGGPWSMVDYNDDCYDGTLNSCLELETRADREYQLLATTYDFVSFRLGTTVESYDLRLVCRDEAGECFDPTEEELPPLCGSRGLAPCAEGFYCNWADYSCGAVDAPGVCTPIPEICPTIYAPVCGCDGVTYSSECWAALDGVDAHTVGDCE